MAVCVCVCEPAQVAFGLGDGSLHQLLSGSRDHKSSDDRCDASGVTGKGEAQNPVATVPGKWQDILL